MTTVFQARPHNFVSTPAVERLSSRALRYLQSGYSVHLRGPAGTGKTTLGLHLADLLSRPIMVLFGDDEFTTADLIGNQLGYTRKKVVDNFIHSVVKVEDELRHNWVDSRLTLACREGFTLVYDEFNRSRPEVNNVLLSALEEKLLVLPPSNSRPEYIRVHPQFRAIFTSNPEEYCGVHGTQDALLDRLVTINMPEPDELTQQQIVVRKTGIDADSALLLIHIVKNFQSAMAKDSISSLRPCLIISTVCQEHNIDMLPENSEFREICGDVLLARSEQSLTEATRELCAIFNQLITDPGLKQSLTELPTQSLHLVTTETTSEISPIAEAVSPELLATHEQAVYQHLQKVGSARLAELELTLGLSRFQVVNALKTLIEKGLLHKQNSGAPSVYKVRTAQRQT
ncbi:MAG: gas vesicle protein GvpN [Leptolyngbyaceae cyanobacterium SL_1_1]|nr:gas vesicle protein GvpN [Leptolyngbyaceae cyanobacterium RM1_1_2]NJO11810.1 gas vesicle protein GvpN [Leptolyngbyaceae cyanobacterium SL_1_1]